MGIINSETCRLHLHLQATLRIVYAESIIKNIARESSVDNDICKKLLSLHCSVIQRTISKNEARLRN